MDVRRLLPLVSAALLALPAGAPADDAKPTLAEALSKLDPNVTGGEQRQEGHCVHGFLPSGSFQRTTSRWVLSSPPR